MKIIYKAALLLLLCGCFALRTAAGTLDQAYGQAVRADTLYAEYKKNPIAAEARFGGNRLSLGGKVKRVGVDANVGVPYVILSGGGELTQGIKCVFPREAMAKLSVLKPGSLVAISGTMEGKRSEMSDQLILQDCQM